MRNMGLSFVLGLIVASIGWWMWWMRYGSGETRATAECLKSEAFLCLRLNDDLKKREYDKVTETIENELAASVIGIASLDPNLWSSTTEYSNLVRALRLHPFSLTNDSTRIAAKIIDEIR